MPNWVTTDYAGGFSRLGDKLQQATIDIGMAKERNQAEQDRINSAARLREMMRNTDEFKSRLANEFSDFLAGQTDSNGRLVYSEETRQAAKNRILSSETSDEAAKIYGSMIMKFAKKNESGYSRFPSIWEGVDEYSKIADEWMSKDNIRQSGEKLKTAKTRGEAELSMAEQGRPLAGQENAPFAGTIAGLQRGEDIAAQDQEAEAERIKIKQSLEAARGGATPAEQFSRAAETGGRTGVAVGKEYAQFNERENEIDRITRAKATAKEKPPKDLDPTTASKQILSIQKQRSDIIKQLGTMEKNDDGYKELESLVVSLNLAERTWTNAQKRAPKTQPELTEALSAGGKEAKQQTIQEAQSWIKRYNDGATNSAVKSEWEGGILPSQKDDRKKFIEAFRRQFGFEPRMNNDGKTFSLPGEAVDQLMNSETRKLHKGSTIQRNTAAPADSVSSSPLAKYM